LLRKFAAHLNSCGGTLVAEHWYRICFHSDVSLDSGVLGCCAMQSEDGGRMFLGNVGLLPQDYMAQQPRRAQFKIYFPFLLLKMTDLWDVVPCSLVEIDRCFGGAHHHDDGGSKHL
jgi:hypothetical protein